MWAASSRKVLSIRCQLLLTSKEATVIASCFGTDRANQHIHHLHGQSYMQNNRNASSDHRITLMRMMSTSSSTTNNDSSGNSVSPPSDSSGLSMAEKSKRAKRVWLALDGGGGNNNNNMNDDDVNASTNVTNKTHEQNHDEPLYWNKSIDETDLSSMRSVLDRVGIQEKQGGRMRQRKLGVLREDPKEDMRLMIENYTVPALASAVRDREDALQLCATLLSEGKVEELADVLRPFEARYVEQRRSSKFNLDLTQNGFDGPSLELLRRGLNRMPRRVSQAHSKRAGVVLPLCNVNGVPCILFEKRSAQLRAHADEVCLPGGMVSSETDKSIVGTCLREMNEEITMDNIDDVVTVLGVLRCNWGEVHHLVGVAVTPVVCYLGEIGNADIQPSADEVAEVFTVPLSLFLESERWVHRQGFAPIFTGGPHVIWGLTGYIIHRFVKDILARYRVQCPPNGPRKWVP